MTTLNGMVRLCLASFAFFALPAQSAVCASGGGGAHCTNPQVLSPWEFGSCREAGDFLGLQYQWCIVLGGTWDPYHIPNYCINGSGSVDETNFMSLATIVETNFNVACSMSASSTGYGAEIESGVCGSGGSVYVNGMVAIERGTATFQYRTAAANGACTSGPFTVRYIIGRSRSIGCPKGYKGESQPNGDLKCYLPPPCDTCLGNPTDAGNGAKRQREADYESASPGGLSFARYYNSTGFFTQSPREAVNADYWRHTYSSRLTPYVANAHVKAAIQRADGFVTYFRLDGREVSNVDGAAAKVEEISGPNGAAWRHTTARSDVEEYDATGRLLTVRTREGFIHTLTYDSSDRLSTVTDAFGRAITLAYSGGDDISTMTDPAGRVYQYAYDGKGRLASVTYPGSRTRSYVYEDATFPFGLTGIVDEREARLSTYTYDSLGRVASSERAGQENRFAFTYYDYGATTITYATDAFGVQRQYEFQKINDTLKLKREQAVGARYATFDANGNRLSNTDKAGNVTTFVHDATRNLETSRTEASGTSIARTIATTWHPAFRLPATITEPSGVAGVNLVTEFTYDASGNLVRKKLTAGALSREWNYTVNSFGQVLTIDGPRTDAPDVTTYTYFPGNDACVGCRGQIATITNAAGHVTTFNAYNADGRPTLVTDGNGLATTFTYHVRGWLESRTAGGETTSYAYDGTGNLIRVTMPDGSWIAYAYDDANGLVEVSDRLGNRIAYELDVMGNRVEEKTYDPQGVLRRNLFRLYDSANRLHKEVGSAGQVTEYLYDLNSNVSTVKDPLVRATSHLYDALDRLTRTYDPAGSYTYFTYDAKDRLATVKDPRNLTTTYAYNGLGDLLQQVSPDTGTTSFAADAAGNTITQTDARGVTTTHAYDALNRVLAATVADGTVGYEYDNVATGGPGARGRLTKITDPSGSTTWAYDLQGRVTAKTQTVNATPSPRVLATAYAFASGRPASMTYPSGRVVSYGYDPQGRIASVSVDGVAVLSGAQYVPFGGATRWSWGNGQLYERSFDLDGRVASVTLGPVGAIYADQSQSFGYDVMGRLASANLAAGQTRGFTYDANGNRTSATVNAATTTYAYPGSSHRLSGLSGATSRSFAYDAAGNVSASAGITYTYDGRGRLKQAGATAYLVNGLGQRVKKAGAGELYFAYDEGGHLIGEYGAAGVVQETVWLADTPVAVVRPNGAGFEIFYIWSDHLDSPRLVSDTANQVRWEWAQGEPFGGNAANENPGGLGSFAFNLRFPGQYFDQETGLHYNYFRDYDPAIGRYVQSDPIGLKGGINSYGYAWARPLAAMDLYGLSPADVQGVFGDVGNSFPDLRPGRDQIGFEPMQPGDTGGTKPWNGQIVVDQSWANKPCFTRDEYEELFFTLFHEGMHSSDSILRRFLTPNSSDDEHHGSIFRREYFERYRPNNTPQKMWGTPRDTPVDIDRLYRKYRERTPACCRGS